MIPNDQSPSIARNHFARLLFRMPIDTFTTEGSLKVTYLDIDDVETFSYGDKSNVYPPPESHYFFDRKTRKFSYNGTFDDVPTILTAVSYIGTEGEYLPANPSVDSADVFYYNPVILEVPKRRVYLSDAVHGYTPIQTSILRIAITDFKELKYFYRASTLNAKLEVFQCIGDIKVENIKKVFTGLCGNIRISGSALSIDINDQYSIFNQSFSALFYNDGIQDVTIPYVYGSVKGIRAALKYLAPPDIPSMHLPTYRIGYFSDGVKSGSGLAGMLSNSGSGGRPNASATSFIVPNHTLTHRRLEPGDRLVISSAETTPPFGGDPYPSGTVKYAEIVSLTAYDSSNTLITHTSTTSAASNSPYVWYALSARAVNIVMQNYIYKAYPFRDYEELLPFGSVSGEIRFLDGYATNLGLPAFLGISDLVYLVRGVGSETDNPIDFIRLVLTDHLGVPTSDIDEATFNSLALEFQDHKIGMSIPASIGSQTPNYQDVLANILQSCLMRLFIGADGRWTLSKVGPMPDDNGVDFYEDTNVLLNSLSCEFSFDDILTEVAVTYNHREISENPLYGGINYDEARVSSSYAEALHGVKKFKEISSYFVSKQSAELLAQRLLYIFGERRCQIRLSASPEYNEIDIGMKCRSKKIQGRNIQYTDVDPEVNGVVVSVDRSERKVEIIIDDQLGIERNKVDWNA